MVALLLVRLLMKKRTRAAVLKDIRDNPDKHQHSFEALQRCCIVGDALDLSLMEAHEGITGRSRRCDVNRGPCGCGGWH